MSGPGLGRRPHCTWPFQWVLAFEVFIPLVLFFILLGLRQKKPTISVKEGECPRWGPGPGGAGSPRCITHASCALVTTRVPGPPSSSSL